MIRTKETASSHSPQEAKRPSKPWRFDYEIPEHINSDFLDAIIVSGVVKPLTLSAVLSSRKGETEPESSFKERIRESTIIPREKQVEDFARHGFTVVAVPSVVEGVKFINLEPLAGAEDPQGNSQNPKFIWHYRRKTKGVLIAISSGKQKLPQFRRLQEAKNSENLIGVAIRFQVEVNPKRWPHYHLERPVLLYRTNGPTS